MALREILAEYGFNIDTSNVQAADSIVESMGDRLLSVGKWVASAFAVGKILDFGKQLIDTADNLSDTSQRLNVSTDDLQAWHYAAKLNGVEADELNSSIQRLGASLADAAKGGGQAKAFKDLGVDLENTDGSLKSSIQVFEEAGVAIGAIADPTKAAGYAADLFGKQYARLLPLFKQGPEGLAKLRKEFEELGGGISAEFIKNAADFNDQIDKLKVVGTSLGSQALGPLVPLVVSLGEGVLSFAAALAGTSKSSDILSLIGRAYGGIVRTVLQLVSGFGKFSNGMKTANRIARVLIEPFLTLEDFLVFLAGGDSVIGDWVDENFGSGTTSKVRALFGSIASGVDNTILNLGWLAKKIIDLGAGAVLVAGDIRDGFLAIPAGIHAAFDTMWNAVIADAASAARRIGAVVKALPGQEDFGLSLEGLGAALAQKPKQMGGAAELAQLQADRTLRYAASARLVSGAHSFLDGPSGGKFDGAAAQAQADAILSLAKATVATQAGHAGPGKPAAVAQGPAGPAQWLVDVQAPTKIDVHVPPGTDADMAKRVGDATAKGTARANNDLSATLAAATAG